MRNLSAEEAVKVVQSGQRVFIQESAATPTALLKALFGRKGELQHVELVSITTMGEGLFRPRVLLLLGSATTLFGTTKSAKRHKETQRKLKQKWRTPFTLCVPLCSLRLKNYEPWVIAHVDEPVVNESEAENCSVR
jgi:hypothetical protein